MRSKYLWQINIRRDGTANCMSSLLKKHWLRPRQGTKLGECQSAGTCLHFGTHVGPPFISANL